MNHSIAFEMVGVVPLGSASWYFCTYSGIIKRAVAIFSKKLVASSISISIHKNWKEIGSISMDKRHLKSIDFDNEIFFNKGDMLGIVVDKVEHEGGSNLQVQLEVDLIEEDFNQAVDIILNSEPKYINI